MIRESREIRAEGESLALDPFAFWPDIQSRIIGFGGTVAGDNPDYAFHTRYVSCGTGSIVFDVTFSELNAPRGTLILRIHELPEVMGAHARQIAMSQTQLADLVRGDGSVSLRAVAREGNHYALLAHIYGDTTATASEVRVDVARRTPDPSDPKLPTGFRAGNQRVDTAPQIIGEREGSLVAPVSQLCTRRQVEEPVFEGLLEQLGGMKGAPVIDCWEHAYLARVLDRYDVARSGARGLGIGAWGDPIADWLAQQGCLLTLTSRARVPEVVADRPELTLLTIGPEAIGDLAGFDFAWATRAGGVGGHDRQALLRFIEDGLRALKPGGLMALVVPIDVAPKPIGDDTGPMLRRQGIDRIALVLLSRGHQVAQICPWGDALADVTEDGSVLASAFGLIVRKAL